mmetsp:Transcript_12314/g.51804  ORF Transcript_12314/g.51804 Transcript_12314/m.51804 type:complete len:221 (-) Transcript_12314:871-1533(-)
MADPPVRVRRPGPARRIVPRPLPGVSGDTVPPRAFIGVAPTLLEPPALEPPLALLPAAGVAASGGAALGGDWRRSRPRPSTAARTALPGDMTSPRPGDIKPMPKRPGDMRPALARPTRPGDFMCMRSSMINPWWSFSEAMNIAASSTAAMAAAWVAGPERVGIRMGLAAAAPPRPPNCPLSSLFLQPSHLQYSWHSTPAWKHSQYFLRHALFLQWHPFLC